MKKYVLAVFSVAMLSLSAQAIERSGKAPTTVISTTGDSLSYLKVVVSSAATAGGNFSTTGIIISSYSSTRSNLSCRNLGAGPIFLGKFPFVAAASSTSYQVDPGSWGVTSFFQTNNVDEVRAIGPAGQAQSQTVYCIEER